MFMHIIEKENDNWKSLNKSFILFKINFNLNNVIRILFCKVIYKPFVHSFFLLLSYLILPSQQCQLYTLNLRDQTFTERTTMLITIYIMNRLECLVMRYKHLEQFS